MTSPFTGTLFGSDSDTLALGPDGGTRNGKSLLKRSTGRFYTPEDIGRPLARNVATHLAARGNTPTITAIDPFCGDGRLIEWLLEEAADRLSGPWVIALWDNDPEAVRVAAERVEATAQRLGVEAAIQPRVGDTFEFAHAEFGRYDAVITNPPWELLKPDRRELDHLDPSQAKVYVSSVRELDQRLGDLYPTAQPLRRFAGWGTNLARVGTEVALRLGAVGGACGVVSPSSLFADTNSERIREWLFQTTTLLHVSYFPAEARLFEHVDQPCVTFVAAKQAPGSSLRFELIRFGADRGVKDRAHLDLSRAELAASGHIVPVGFGALGMKLLQSLSHLPTFAELEADLGMWAGRELDETNRRRYILKNSPHPFLKARNVQRFSQDHVTEEYVDSSVVKLPPSTQHPRLVWRDVSRPSQKRRVQATLIERGWVTGNSLHVAYSRTDDLARLAWLLGVMSSIPFEYQVRSSLSTGHVSLASVRRVRLPDPGAASVEIGELVHQRLGAANREPELEAAVAKAYGLEREAVEAMIDAFPKISDDEAQAVLQVV